MLTQVYINLPVSDLDNSKTFYTALGWTVNPTFTNDDAAAITISDTIHVMLLTHKHYANFTDKIIADTHATSGVINAVGAGNADDVDAVVERAIAAGATEGAVQNLGFMRSRSFADPDGHLWEIMWMDPIVEAGDWDAIKTKYPEAFGDSA